MESNQLAVYQNFDNISKAAKALQKSGYFKDVTSEAQAIVKVMAGAELGLPPFASMAGIHIINGKPALGSNVVATLVKNDPRYDYRIDECNNKICAINWFEDGKLVGVSTFTMEEANAAGITGKPTWKAYPSDMLFARAITRGARRFAPGIFGGSPIYTPEELGADVDEEGYIDTIHRITVEKPEIKIFVDEPESMVEAAVELGGQVKSSLSLETAKAIKNSEGVNYGDIDTETLSHMANAIQKAIKKNGMSHEKHEEHQLKLDAIKVILESRQ